MISLSDVLFLKLISCFYKPTKGEVLIDGTNLNEIDLNSYYEDLTYISQDSVIFDGSLRENIVFDKKIDDKKIIDVLKLVSLEKFYNNLKDGLDTNLGEKGVLVSGGERQRIALARLFFDESKIIILDEATSQMDNITEKEVMKNITKLADKTIIIIAHRLDSIKDSDVINVMLDGKIIASGKYDELKKTNKYFKNLTTKKN